MASFVLKIHRSDAGRRAITFLAITTAVFGAFIVVRIALTPPDAITNLLVTIPGIVVSLVVGYSVVYGRGTDSLDRLRR